MPLRLAWLVLIDAPRPGPRGGRRHRGLAAPARDRGDPHRAARPSRVRRWVGDVTGQIGRRHLHRPGGRHGPAPADRAGRAPRSHPAWSPDGTRIAYRVWQDGTDSIVVMDAGGGDRTNVGDERPERPVVLHARRPGVVAGRVESHLPDQLGVRRSGFDLFIVATDGSAPATRLLAAGHRQRPRGVVAGRHEDRVPRQRRARLAPACTWPMWDRGGALAGGLTARRIGA